MAKSVFLVDDVYDRPAFLLQVSNGFCLVSSKDYLGSVVPLDLFHHVSLGCFHDLLLSSIKNNVPVHLKHLLGQSSIEDRKSLVVIDRRGI